MIATVLPTKKQRVLLDFIDQFINANGYSPSYREIMSSLHYNSVATVALHVNNLIKRGHLIKRDHSARSLELPESKTASIKLKTNDVKASEEKWLVDKVEYFFEKLEQSSAFETALLDELYVMIAALKVLGLNGAAQSFMPRLSVLKERSK
jgi:SOS-response transcriptional repressor LexA